MRNLYLFFCALLIATACKTGNSGSNDESIKIATAANMQFAMDSIGKMFENKYNIKCEVSSNSSGMLTAQIENGAPYDVFVSANMRYPNKLVKSGFGSSPEIYAYGRLAFVYSGNETFNTIEEAMESDAIRRIAVAEKKTAPYGMAAMEYLKATNGINIHKSKIVYGESVGQVNQYLETHAVDAAFTSYSFVRKFSDKYNFLEVDQSYFKRISQGVVLLKSGKENNPKASKLFIEFLKSDDCQAVLTHFGYLVE